MTGPDLLDLLAGDHRNLLAADDEGLVGLLSQHLSVERDLLYQGISQFCLDEEGMVEGLRRNEGALEERMSGFEAGATAEHRAALHQALQGHIEAVEGLFPELRRCLPGWWLTQVVDMVPMIIGGSPTHGHRRLAESGPIGEVVEDLSSIADHIRDHTHRWEGR